MIGGERRTLRLVAEHADEWNPGFVDPEAYLRKNVALADHCAAVHSDPPSILRTLMVGHIVGRDRKELLERAAKVHEYLVGNQPLYLLRP